MLTLAYCTLVVLLAFVGEAMFGFGGGLVAVPLLTLALDVRDAIILSAIFQFLIGFLVFRNYRAVAWKLMPSLMCGVIVGTVIGTVSLGNIDVSMLRILLALFIIGFLAKTFFIPQLAVSKPSAVIGLGSGLLSGLFQGCLGTGGPNLVIYLKNTVPDRQSFRASMIFALAVANLARMLTAGTVGLFTRSVWALALPILPLFVIGVIFGQRSHAKIPEEIYFKIVYVFLSFSAVSLIWRSI